jgi:hypothetical protein
MTRRCRAVDRTLTWMHSTTFEPDALAHWRLDCVNDGSDACESASIARDENDEDDDCFMPVSDSYGSL